eukprot:3452039-Rhodomonas_salina.2
MLGAVMIWHQKAPPPPEEAPKKERPRPPKQEVPLPIMTLTLPIKPPLPRPMLPLLHALPGTQMLHPSPSLHPEIKYKKTHSWYNVFGDCVFLYLISQCMACPVLRQAMLLPGSSPARTRTPSPRSPAPLSRCCTRYHFEGTTRICRAVSAYAPAMACPVPTYHKQDGGSACGVLRSGVVWQRRRQRQEERRVRTGRSGAREL